jgi:hypothetical protein
MPYLGLTHLHSARAIRLANEVATPRQDLKSMGFRSPVSQVELDNNLWPLKLRSSKRHLPFPLPHPIALLLVHAHCVVVRVSPQWKIREGWDEKLPEGYI